MKCTSGPLESRISEKIREAIKTQISGAVVRKRHVTMGVTGDPDIYGSLPNGLHFEIEVKRPGYEPTPLQLERMREWKASGAIVGCAHSVEEALAILFEGRYEHYQ